MFIVKRSFERDCVFFVADFQALVYLYLLKYVKIFGGNDIMLIFVP